MATALCRTAKGDGCPTRLHRGGRLLRGRARSPDRGELDRPRPSARPKREPLDLRRGRAFYRARAGDASERSAPDIRRGQGEHPEGGERRRLKGARAPQAIVVSLREGGLRKRRVLAHAAPDDLAVAEGEVMNGLGLLE